MVFLEMIFDPHSVFVMSDNTLVSYECINHVVSRTRGKKNFAVVKLDMSKVYDRVEQVFLQRIMCHLRFLIHGCRFLWIVSLW